LTTVLARKLPKQYFYREDAFRDVEVQQTVSQH